MHLPSPCSPPSSYLAATDTHTSCYQTLLPSSSPPLKPSQLPYKYIQTHNSICQKAKTPHKTHICVFPHDSTRKIKQKKKTAGLLSNVLFLFFLLWNNLPSALTQVFCYGCWCFSSYISIKTTPKVYNPFCQLTGLRSFRSKLPPEKILIFHDRPKESCCATLYLLIFLYWSTTKTAADSI